MTTVWTTPLCLCCDAGTAPSLRTSIGPLDLSACLSLSSRFPPLGFRLGVSSREELPPLLCALTLCFPSPPESKGGGRAIGLLLPPVEPQQRRGGAGACLSLASRCVWAARIAQHANPGLLSSRVRLSAFSQNVIKRNQAGCVRARARRNKAPLPPNSPPPPRGLSPCLGAPSRRRVLGRLPSWLAVRGRLPAACLRLQLRAVAA